MRVEIRLRSRPGLNNICLKSYFKPSETRLATVTSRLKTKY